MQISLDGATAEVNDHVRGPGSYDTAITALTNLRDAGFTDAKISVVCTRQNIGQLDEFQALADEYGATLRLTRLRPSGRGADVWDELHPLPEQQRVLYDWLLARGRRRAHGRLVLPPRRVRARRLPGLNLCGAGRVVCLIDPIGDVYACPFAIHDNFLAGNLLRRRRVQARSGRPRSCSRTCARRRPAAPARSAHFYDSCRGGCMAAKFFTGLPLDGPDPECVQGYGETALASADRVIPAASQDHSKAAPTRNEPVMLQADDPAAGQRLCREPAGGVRAS